MRIAVVGAGVAGLCTAKVLAAAGHDVVVIDRTPDVGGVWSATRRYPGLCTQSAKDTYAFSDHPMPAEFPEWPDGEQVQAYLASYAERFGVDRLLRLGTEVVRAEQLDAGWRLTTRPVDGSAEVTETVDHLVVANGVFSEPALPDFAGLEDFTTAGGRVASSSGFADAGSLDGAHVVVVGYGKSACDVAVAVADAAASTDVIARQLLWKVPRHIGGVLNFKHLLLTRMGEALFRYIRLQGFEKVIHGPGRRVRARMMASVGAIATRQDRLRELDLVPRGRFEDIVRGAIGLTTEGFFERVRSGVIRVRRDRVVVRLLEKEGVPHVELDDGTVLRADLLLCATGFRQGVAFLDPELHARLLDEHGNYRLYRQIHPVDVENLSFAGYNSSFFSPLNAEMAAVWIAARLAGRLALPEKEAMRAHVDAQLAFMDDATDGHHCRGTKIIPFSLHNVDEVLGDLDLQIPARVRAAQWLNPVDPGAYRDVTPRLLARLGTAPV
ncbi:flavin-containing monooxygenase [Actinomycetospora termitidis]|uniref:NAD(P)/FAD-dependent oxidoreductase n=1 Tax=Actinomycetospora termitidis TaxID=3053470 RepID=A0ABT7M3E1_9PSEU|nr:NAD(P)/FAD-dependent oxidoreductase [Actinomycetospora sp. Odt1-22]MDL5155184.1 NAD(P)/FAD-dependent oxidoreductase [Actinomycetospora sp. Odt1-22]